MAKRNRTPIVALALAAATPGLFSTSNANARQVPTPPQLPADAATPEHQELLKAELALMTPAEKMTLGSERVSRTKLIILEARNTGANCSNPCKKTKLLCPHKTNVTGGCPTLPRP